MKISKRFKTMLIENGLTQTDFAAGLGVTQNYISLLISGEKEKISKTLALLIPRKVRVLCGMDTDWRRRQIYRHEKLFQQPGRTSEDIIG